MQYNLTAAANDKWISQAFDSFGGAVQAAVAGLTDGWKETRIEAADGTIVREQAIRDIHEVITSGALDA